MTHMFAHPRARRGKGVCLRGLHWATEVPRVRSLHVLLPGWGDGPCPVTSVLTSLSLPVSPDAVAPQGPSSLPAVRARRSRVTVTFWALQDTRFAVPDWSPELV